MCSRQLQTPQKTLHGPAENLSPDSWPKLAQLHWLRGHQWDTVDLHQMGIWPLAACWADLLDIIFDKN